ncbi:MAG: hypothetical protein ACI9D4_002412 [Polaribacter sp.]|jgi:hypothetical protein
MFKSNIPLLFNKFIDSPNAFLKMQLVTCSQQFSFLQKNVKESPCSDINFFT